MADYSIYCMNVGGRFISFLFDYMGNMMLMKSRLQLQSSFKQVHFCLVNHFPSQLGNEYQQLKYHMLNN